MTPNRKYRRRKNNSKLGIPGLSESFTITVNKEIQDIFILELDLSMAIARDRIKSAEQLGLFSNFNLKK